MVQEFDLVILGGGAAGIFAAIQAKIARPHARVVVLEKTARLLAKVRISGGGRCNVTHGRFEPEWLCKNYPRGSREVKALFHRFGPREMFQFLEERGVLLKTESDGRVFPKSNNSETIIDAFLTAAEELGVEIRKGIKIKNIDRNNEQFVIDHTIAAKKLLLATGSSRGGHAIANQFGHTIEPCVPSLFTFQVPNFPLSDLSGIAIDDVKVEIVGTSFSMRGPLLITHFGFSGPAVLKLSAFAARYLHDENYKATLKVNFLPKENGEKVVGKLKGVAPSKRLYNDNPLSMPKKFMRHFCGEKTARDFSKSDWAQLVENLVASKFNIDGKAIHKEEFVTCGGVCRKEVNFKTLESKKCPGLYFAGEILDVDGVTGGFNFQNGWSTAFVAATSAMQDL